MTDTKTKAVEAEFKMKADLNVESNQNSGVVPFDEELLEKSRTQWQFGHWESLLMLDKAKIQHHPDRPKLALFAASARLVKGDINEAVHYLQWAKDLGVNKNTILRILLASAHNTLGSLSYLTNQQPRALRHFEKAIASVTPGVDAKLFAKAKLQLQLNSLDLHQDEDSKVGKAYVPIAQVAKFSDVSYLFYLTTSVEMDSVFSMGFNTTSADYVNVEGDVVHFDTKENKPLYFVSSESGSFDKPPTQSKIAIKPSQAYVLSGKIQFQGFERPVVWVFQYADGARLDSANQKIQADGLFKIELNLSDSVESIAFGIRLSGKGSIYLTGSQFNLRSFSGHDALQSLDEKLDRFKSVQQQEIQNSMRQIEDTLRLQNYLGPDVVLPDMHRWAISPDFGVFLINQIEQNNYDAIVEFGSGTSTVLIAKAIQKRRERLGFNTNFLSFDHLEEYQVKTQNLLKQSRVDNECSVTFAPLIDWVGPNTQVFPYYDCGSALKTLSQSFQNAPINILVIVDGPPAATGPHSRYPALQMLLEAFADSKASIDFLLDDYCRQDEKEIVGLWKQYLSELNMQCGVEEYNKLEKQACILKTVTSPPQV